MLKPLALTATLVTAFAANALDIPATAGRFADNPIVYFVITDRFYNGDPGNDESYGRRPDDEQEIGTFHGGDLAGLTQKLQEGYFRDLGVNALWITAPYEQIRGWVVGGDKTFKHYAYHGYYALDYTVLDHNMGTEEELQAFVDTAHEQGIRVLFDVVMNHPGYGDLRTLDELGVEVVWDGWENAQPHNYHSFIDYNNFNFEHWWGNDWVRADLPGYKPGDPYNDKTMNLAYLPDFRTESSKPVAIPRFLRNKPDTRIEAIEGYTVRDYLVKWLTDWVRRYGIDGFRCDTVKHVEHDSWKALKAAGSRALAAWKAEHPEQSIDDAGFWMVGEVFPHGVERTEYFENGFDNIINFDFQDRAGDLSTIDEVYAEYAAKISQNPDFNVLSYISSHDTRLFDRDKLTDAGTALLLAPGGVQIFYGDESGRPAGYAPPSDEQQATRSPMNWTELDQDLLAHWQKLGQFRNRHVALAKGAHRKLSDAPYTFSREHPADRVVVALGVRGTAIITVGDVFADGERVRDFYSGKELTVTDGRIILEPDSAGVVLLESAL